MFQNKLDNTFLSKINELYHYMPGRGEGGGEMKTKGAVFKVKFS